MPLVNCEIEVDLSWTRTFISSKVYRTAPLAGNPNANLLALAEAAISTTSASFQINNAKLYPPVVTLSTNHNTKFLENLKQGFKRTIS